MTAARTALQPIPPYAPGFQLDPHPTLAALRESEGMTRIVHPFFGDSWMATRYQDVKQLLTDERVVKPIRPDDPVSLDFPPPVHTRLRRLMLRVFSPARIARLMPSKWITASAQPEIPPRLSQWATSTGITS